MARLRYALLAPLALASAACVEQPPAPVPAPPLARPGPVQPAPAFSFEGERTQGGLLFGTAPRGSVSVALDGKPVRFAPDGRFMIGFDRDASPVAQVDATLADGAHVRETLRIKPRVWDVQSLPTLPKGTTPTPEFLARRKIELNRIEAARALQSDAQGWRERFVWPVHGRISGVFGSQRIYAGEPGSPHTGVDIARPTGTPVAAPADGVVILAAQAPFTLEGRLLMIDHGMGLNSAFLHLSRIDVVEGQKVTRGQIVGAIGTTGRSTGAHLHWGMKLGDVRIDPQLIAGPMPQTP